MTQQDKDPAQGATPHEDASSKDERAAQDGQGTGYRRPPLSTRFRKGQSGNPKGRPRGRKKGLPYEAVLGQIVTIREDGRERRVSAEEAFLLHLAKTGLGGDGPAARAALAALEEARARRPTSDLEAVSRIIMVSVAPGSVTPALEPLRMAKRMDAFRDTAHILLEPWLVEAALNRLGSRRLTEEDQTTVLIATRTPGKVRWPDWWTIKP